MNETDEVAQAVGIKGNKIVFVGSNADIAQLLDSHTKVYDLAGRSLLPGFNDSHFHPILNGMLGPDMSCGMIDTTKKNCPSLEAMLQMIRKTASTLQPGRWISMMGYEPTLFPEDAIQPLRNWMRPLPTTLFTVCMAAGISACITIRPWNIWGLRSGGRGQNIPPTRWRL